MKNKKTIIWLLTFCFLILMNVPLLATDQSWGLSTSEIGPSEISELSPIATNFFGVLQWVGYFIAILMFIWVGIRYVTSSVGEKVKAKESVMPMLIGAILVTCATTIAAAWFNV